MAHLEVVIQKCQEALNRPPADDSDDLSSRLSDLGLAYSDKYHAKGAIVDLERALQCHREALDQTSADNPNDRANQLAYLGFGHACRYQVIGATDDVKTATQCYEQALDLTPTDHVRRPSRLRDLGARYQDNYQVTGEIADLEKALSKWQEALDITSEDHHSRASILWYLGLACFDAFPVIEDLKLLDTAIRLGQDAHDKTPADDPNWVFQLDGLGTYYFAKFNSMRAIADLDKAIQHYQKALNITPLDNPERANRLGNLGLRCLNKYQVQGATADSEIAMQLLQEALDSSPAPVLDRIIPGITLTDCHAKNGDWLEAFHVASKVVSLIPALIPRSLVNSDKQRLIINVAGHSNEAAAAAINAARTPYDAIQLLEIGREVISGSLNEIRTDISELQRKHPELAEEYISLRDQIDTPQPSTQRQVDQRIDAGQNLEKKIHTIRALPGFDRFLLAPSEEEVKAAAKHGPIVVINISTYRCDALIIEHSRLRTLELPRLHLNDIFDRANTTIEIIFIISTARN